MDSGCTPERIGLCHPANRITDLSADRRPAGTSGKRLKSPEQLKALSVPLYHGLGLDDD